MSDDLIAAVEKALPCLNPKILCGNCVMRPAVLALVRESVAEARRPLVESLRECSEAMSALVVMITNDMAGDEANGMRRFKSSAFVDVILRARAALLAAEKKGETG